MENKSKKEEFDYSELWEEEEDKQTKKELKEISKGLPRKGIKGKYIKRKNYVSKNKIKHSYITGFKRINEKEG